VSVGPTSASLTLIEVGLASESRSALAGNAAGAPLLAKRLLANDGKSLATEAEVHDAERWLSDVTGHSRTLSLRTHQLVATWGFPCSPLIQVELDGNSAPHGDYMEHSSSARWAISWDDAPRRPLALIPLATFVPEEVDRDHALRTFAMEVALEATAQHLLHRPVQLA